MSLHVHKCYKVVQYLHIVSFRHENNKEKMKMNEEALEILIKKLVKGITSATIFIVLGLDINASIQQEDNAKDGIPRV